jgi:hypothetical protein
MEMGGKNVFFRKKKTHRHKHEGIWYLWEIGG